MKLVVRLSVLRIGPRFDASLTQYTHEVKGSRVVFLSRAFTATGFDLLTSLYINTEALCCY